MSKTTKEEELEGGGGSEAIDGVPACVLPHKVAVVCVSVRHITASFDERGLRLLLRPSPPLLPPPRLKENKGSSSPPYWPLVESYLFIYFYYYYYYCYC